MLLSLKERYEVMNLLPNEGSRVTGKLIKKVLDDLLPDEVEIKKYRITEGGQFFTAKGKMPVQVPQGQVLWDSTIEDVPKNIDLGEVVYDIVVAKLKELESAKKLPLSMGDLYDRIVTNGEK